MGARTTALSVLIACRRQGAFSDGALKEYTARDRLDRRDAALAARLCYGVEQNRLLLDFYLSRFVRGRLKDLQPVVLDILRLGAYQILFLEKVPDAAAVNEAVTQTKKYANARASGLVNGVLRSLSRGKNALPEPPDLATKYSHPAELVVLLQASLGAETEAFLRANNEAPETVLQWNPLRGSEQTLLEELDEKQIAWERHPWLPGCYLVRGTGDLRGLAAFETGLVYVQDAAARAAALASGVEPGMRVLDCCAAPGGKSFAAAIAMQNRGDITSCDLHAHKIALIEAGGARLGISILHAQQQDATVFCPEWGQAMDVVIADVPCSGLGVIRKKPDIRYKDVAQLAGLSRVQTAILETVCRYVKPGGTLLYSTCTVLKRENEHILEAFLAAHPEFQPERFTLPAGSGVTDTAMATLLPQRSATDGFFIGKLRRIG